MDGHSTSTVVIKLIAVLLLVAANGFFVAAEFAFVGVRSSRIETLAASGSRSAKRLPVSLPTGNHARFACTRLDW
jgi:CBS domain containing-hemolysin-like protein